MQIPPGAATAGLLAWQQAGIDPARYRFKVRTAPAGDATIGGWMASPGTE